MKIAVLSDLHLEISPWEVPARTLAEADVIVLAGDIHMTTHGLSWARLAFPGKKIIYVCGNHEFWGGTEIHGLIREMRRVAAELYIDFLEQNEVVIDGVRFLGTTLWTDFQLFGAGAAMGVAMQEAGKYMPDFDGRIRCSPMPTFRPADSVELHRKSRDWLAAKLDEPFDGKTVVVTHHPLSMRSIAARYAEDPVSAAFASNLDDLIAKAHLCIHGHTHTAFRYQVGPYPERGHVVCNPRGCRRETYAGVRGEKTGWHPRLLVDTEKLVDEISAWQNMPDVGLERVASAEWICSACVEQLGLERGSVLSITAHKGKCDVCGKEAGVMPAEDFQ